MKALIFGSLNIDNVYSVDHFVNPGETIESKGLQLFCGGKGHNQAIAFAKCGVETWMAGAVGKNDSGILLESLENAAVNTSLIQKKDAATGQAIIQVTPKGENGILLFGGANRMITKEDVDEVLSHFEAGDYLILQNEINQLPYIMESAKKIGMKIVLNPSPMDETAQTLADMEPDYLIVNEIEGAAIAGTEEKYAEKILWELTKRYPHTGIILTVGKDGSWYSDSNGIFYQPIYPVETVDTTAAGDTYTGFFFGSLMEGKKVREALILAAKASSIAVTRKGAGPSIPGMEEVLVSLK